MYFHREKQKHSVRLTIFKSKSPTRTPYIFWVPSVHLELSVLGTLANSQPGLTLPGPLRVVKLGPLFCLMRPPCSKILIKLLRTDLGEMRDREAPAFPYEHKRSQKTFCWVHPHSFPLNSCLRR